MGGRGREGGQRSGPPGFPEFRMGVDASKVFQLASTSFGIETLGVPAFALFKWGIYKDLQKFSRLKDFPGCPSLCSKGRDEADQHNQPSIDHQFRDLGDAAQVLHSIHLGETQIPIKPVSDIVSIKQISVSALGMELLLSNEAMVDRAGESGEPDTPWSLALLCCPLGLADLQHLQWMFEARRRAKSSIPAPNVLKDCLSMRMKPPRIRLCA